jgi:hypothetical protein
MGLFHARLEQVRLWCHILYLFDGNTDAGLKLTVRQPLFDISSDYCLAVPGDYNKLIANGHRYDCSELRGINQNKHPATQTWIKKEDPHKSVP